MFQRSRSFLPGLTDLLPAGLLLIGLALAAPGSAGAGEAAPDAVLAAALRSAVQDPAVPLSLEVECSDRRGPRSLTLYPSGVLIWGGQRQARIGAAERTALLQDLLEAEFAGFAARYGGRPVTVETGAPVMVLCRIAVTAGEASKSSYQDINGERSEAFMALAACLLDRVEALGERGVTAASLADGLRKLAAGELAPEALRVQLMRLPSNPGEMGVIFRVDGAKLSVRDYRPGIEVGETRTRALSDETLQALLVALSAADLDELPARLPAPDLYRLQLQVLQHLQRLEARPADAPTAAAPGSASERLVRLAEALLALP